MAVACFTMQAQTKKVKVLAKCRNVFFTTYPEVTVDNRTKKKTMVWHDTENNSWHENMGFVKNVPTTTIDIEKYFPQFAGVNEGRPLSPIVWQLTEERQRVGDGTSGMNDETVLHCYFRMPADIVENFWLCSEECVILDKETGTIYQSRRCVPDCYGKVFSIKEKEGTVLDFQIFFPKLPETVKEIAIYGVPNWCLQGQNVYLDYSLFMRDLKASIRYFDEMVPIHKAHLVSEAKDYNKDDHKTWAVYNDAHLILPVKEDTYAIWRTEEATYLAEACEMSKMREYFKGRGNSILIDQSGHQYKCKEVLDYPNDDLFWVDGYSGDYFAIVRVFEPIPLYLENITYIEPEGEPFAMWGANWEGKVLSFNIKELLDNQKLFKYHPRELVK
jgi:hypothetical protein